MTKKALLVHQPKEFTLHTPFESSMIMKEIIQNEGYEIEIHTTLEPYADEELMGSVDLIVQCWTGGHLSEQQQRGLIEAVMNGAGFAGWHGGFNDSFRDSLEYKFLTGSLFVSHPSGTVEFKVHITEPEDPIVNGIGDFSLESELYYLHVDPGIMTGITGKLLATTTFQAPFLDWYDGNIMPVIYKRVWGDGKIFYVSFGHTYKDFDIPQTREIMRRGFLWATR